MIRRCDNRDFETIYSIIDDAAKPTRRLSRRTATANLTCLKKSFTMRLMMALFFGDTKRMARFLA